jgi:hypothetical protein
VTILRGNYTPARRCDSSAKPGIDALVSFTLARFPAMRNGGTFVCRQIPGSSTLSVHAERRAFDAMTGTGEPTRESKWLAEQLRVFSAELGIQGIIHNRRCWFSNAGALWQPYHGSNPHTNHIHAEETVEMAARLTLARVRRVLIGPSINGPINGPVLKSGATGHAVYELQGRLRDHGFGIARDSTMGPATVAAVKRFQQLAGIPADSIVGPVTWGRLR